MGRGWFQQARILAASLSLAWPAGAADGAETEDAATRLFREGRALLRDGRVDEACEKLRASLELTALEAAVRGASEDLVAHLGQR